MFSLLCCNFFLWLNYSSHSIMRIQQFIQASESLVELFRQSPVAQSAVTNNYFFFWFSLLLCSPASLLIFKLDGTVVTAQLCYSDTHPCSISIYDPLIPFIQHSQVKFTLIPSLALLQTHFCTKGRLITHCGGHSP